MSADGFFADAEADVLSVLLDALRANADVRSVLGTPARIFDNGSPAPVFPYAEAVRFETRPFGSALHAEHEHRITLAVLSRYGGRVEARRLLGVLRRAIDAADLTLPGQWVVLKHIVYADVLRTSDLRAFRGLIRVRLITEEAA